ncbi:OprD family outer membrane porin, partial [Pseudomonas aeruginosa]
FIEGREVNLLLRNFYFNRDFRKGQSSPAGGGYTEEWVQGFMANFSSGFTQGTLGVGIDAFAQLGVRLDSGGGRSGAGGSVDLLPYDDQGRPQDDYSRAGGAVKLRWYGTVLRVGDVFPETPVIQYGNSRLFPSSFRGFTLVNDSLAKGLTLQAGKLNSMTQPNSTSGSDDFYSFYTGRRIDSP